MDYHCSVNAEPPICFCLSCCHLWQLHSLLAVLHCIVANFDATPHFGSLYHSQCPCSPCCIAFFLILTPPHVHFDFSSCCYCSCCHHSLDGSNKCWCSLYCCCHARLIVGWKNFPLPRYVTGLLLSILLSAPPHCHCNCRVIESSPQSCHRTVVVTRSCDIAIASFFIIGHWRSCLCALAALVPDTMPTLPQHCPYIILVASSLPQSHWRHWALISCCHDC